MLSIMNNSNSSSMTVFVTAGSGLVGRAIRDEIEGTNSYDRFKFIFINSRDADLTDFDQTQSIFKLHKPSYVINLAGKVGGLCANDEGSFYDINIHAGPPHDSNANYSLTKRHVNLLNQKYNKSCPNSLFTAVIPTNVNGIHDHFNSSQSHVILGLFYKAYRVGSMARRKGQTEACLEVCGSGKPLRQFIHACDLGKLILWTLENYNDPEPLILSIDETGEVSIGHVANLIAQTMSNQLEVRISVRFETTKSDGQFKKTASSRKLRELCPDFRFTPLEERIKKVVDRFYQSHSHYIEGFGDLLLP